MCLLCKSSYQFQFVKVDLVEIVYVDRTERRPTRGNMIMRLAN